MYAIKVQRILIYSMIIFIIKTNFQLGSCETIDDENRISGKETESDYDLLDENETQLETQNVTPNEGRQIGRPNRQRLRGKLL